MNTSTAPVAASANRWEYLQELYEQLSALVAKNLDVLKFRTEVQALPEDHPERARLLDLLQVIQNDSENVQRRLSKVQRRHAGRTGSYEGNMDQLIVVIGISEEYQEIHTLYLEAAVCMMEEFLNSFQKVQQTLSS